MNKEFMNLNGNTIVSSDDGEIKVIPDYQNPEEILKQENLIETIDKLIEALLKQKENTVPYKSGFKRKLCTSLAMISMPLLVGGFIKFVLGLDPVVYETQFGNLSAPAYLSLVITYACFCSDLVNATVGKYFSKKECKEKKDALDSSIEYLESKKIEEQRKLYELMKNNKVENPEKVTIGPITIHNPEALKEIERFVHVNYQGRLNLKKYYKHYLNGTLQFVLEKEKELNNMDYYMDYIEEKGPRLIKNFRTSDKY